MKRGHIPVRMCCICRTRAPKHSLTRYVLSDEGKPIPDFTWNAPGRGLYICKEFHCQEAMTRRSAKKKERGSNR